ncbi:MAG: glycerophosphodiester phosphodiesterase family protein [candidate division FCPU426 bacterium]
MNPKVCAHRGFAAEHTENTFASIAAAYKLGCRWAECDIQLSAEGVPLLYHDASLKRISRVSGDIRKTPLARARELGITRLASLAPLFKRHPQAKLFVELKTESMRSLGREAVLDAVLKAIRPFERRCVLISFDIAALALARQKTKLPIGFVMSNRFQLRLGSVAALRPDFVFRDLRSLAKKGDLRLAPINGQVPRQCVWEVPDPKVAAGLFARGIDMIETFAVDRYLESA